MSFDIRPINKTEVESARQLLASNGWAHRVGSAIQFNLLIENSTFVHVAIENSNLIGFIRGIGDHLSNGYISMLVVDPNYRRQGIGRALVKSLIRQNTDVTWMLRAGRENAKEFFSSLGFTDSEQAMELKRSC